MLVYMTLRSFQRKENHFEVQKPSLIFLALSFGFADYTDCISAEG